MLIEYGNEDQKQKGLCPVHAYLYIRIERDCSRAWGTGVACSCSRVLRRRIVQYWYRSSAIISPLALRDSAPSSLVSPLSLPLPYAPCACASATRSSSRPAAAHRSSSACSAIRSPGPYLRNHKPNARWRPRWALRRPTRCPWRFGLSFWQRRCRAPGSTAEERCWRAGYGR